MRSNTGVNILLALLLCTIFLTGFSYAGTAVFETFLYGGSIAANTKVASIVIGGLRQEEAKQKVAEKIHKWVQTEPISVTFMNKKVTLPEDIYQFNIGKSVNEAIMGKDAPLYADLDPAILESTVKEAAGNFASEINVNKLQQDLQSAAVQLNGNQTFSLQSYLTGDSNTVISEMTVQNIGNPLLAELVKKHPEIKVSGLSQWSLLESFEQDAKNNEEILSTLGSAIFRTILSTNFEIIERHIGMEKPKTAELGYEAKVVPGYMDFKLFNPNQTDYKIAMEFLGDTLHLTVKGKPLLYSYEPVLEDKQTFRFKKIIRYDASLSEGQERTIQSGEEGYLVKIFRKQNDVKPKAPLTEDFYPPIHQIVLKPYNPAVQTTQTVLSDLIQGQQTLPNGSLQTQLPPSPIQNQPLPNGQIPNSVQTQDPVQSGAPAANQQSSADQNSAQSSNPSADKAADQTQADSQEPAAQNETSDTTVSNETKPRAK